MSDTNDKFAKGQALLARLFEGVKRDRSSLPRRMQEYTLGHLFGDLWQGPDLPLPERSLITCATLVALGRTNEQRLHFIGARNLGIPRAKIEEMITHVAHYA